MNCKKCGTPAQPGDTFCKQCGEKLTSQENSQTPIIIALIAAIGIFVIVLIVFICLLLSSGKSSDQTKHSYALKPENTQTIQTTPAPAPVFSRIEASSYRASDMDEYGNVYYYNPEYAVDGNLSTCWAADSTFGLNPSITLRSSTPQHVTGVRFSNGYFRTKTTYESNRRITKIRISYEGGNQDVSCRIDQYRMMQEIQFATPVDTTYLTLQVLDSVNGRWNDICISEIEVY